MPKLYPITLTFLLLSLLAHAQDTFGLKDSLKNSSTEDQIRYINSFIDKKGADHQGELLYEFVQKIHCYAKKVDNEALLEEVKFIEEVKHTYTEPKAQNRLKVYKNLLEDYRDDHNRYRVAICLHYIGQNQFVLGAYGKAFENLLRAKKLFKEIGYGKVPNIGKYLHDLALDFYYFKNYRQAISLMKTAIRLPKYNANLDIQRYNTLGMAYLKINQPDSARVYLKKSLKRATVYKDSVWIGIASGNLGKVYIDTENYEKAHRYFKDYYDFSAHIEKYPGLSKEACLNLANLYVKMDTPEKALPYIREAEDYFPPEVFQFGEQQQFEIAKKNYYKAFYSYHINKGNLQMALRYKDSLTISQKLENQKYNAALISLSRERIALKEKKNYILLQKERNAEMKLVYGMIILIMASLAISGAGFYYMQRLKKKREKEGVERELENAKSSINFFLSHIKEKNKLIDKFDKDLKKLKRYQLGREKEINEAIEELRETKILTEEDWIRFRMDFKKLYPHFSTTIQLHYPRLTPSEIRYLMLIKIGLSHKEMAKTLGISTVGIRVTWNRLRKKVKGNLKDSPQSLIQEIDEHQLESLTN